MLRKTWAVVGLAAVSLFAAPAALAYTPPDAPDIIILTETPQITPNSPVQVRVENLLPNSDAVFSVAADGVDSADIHLAVDNRTGTGSIHATVESDGSFTVAVTFPTAATYTLSATGLDKDGNRTTVSTTIQVFAGGGLPHTGFSGRDLAVGGLALIAAGISAVILGRRKRVLV